MSTHKGESSSTGTAEDEEPGLHSETFITEMARKQAAFQYANIMGNVYAAGKTVDIFEDDDEEDQEEDEGEEETEDEEETPDDIDKYDLVQLGLTEEKFHYKGEKVQYFAYDEDSDDSLYVTANENADKSTRNRNVDRFIGALKAEANVTVLSVSPEPEMPRGNVSVLQVEAGTKRR